MRTSPELERIAERARLLADRLELRGVLRELDRRVRDLRLIEPLSSTLGVEDLEDILEVMTIDAHNAKIAAKLRERK